MIQTRYYKTIRVIVDSDGGGTPFYIENVDSQLGYFKLYIQGSPTYTPNLNYRIDNGEWFEYDVVNLPSIEVPIGSKIYLKGNNPNGFNQSSSNGYRFSFKLSTTSYDPCNFNIGGYITSLLALENFNLINNIPNYSFGSFFASNKELLSAENLITSNITSVGVGSFTSCFVYCSSLVTAPKFENVTSVGAHGFNGCFNNCTSLVTAPSFENVTSVGANGFSSCFSNCKSLVTAPSFENVTSVGESGLYRVFYECTSLVTGPSFKNVTTVSKQGLEECFWECTSLVTGPSFKNVTSLGNYCFRNCFRECTSLNTIIAPRPSTWNISTFNSWVYGVSSTGTLSKKKGLEIPTGASGIPEGWTVIEED